MDGEQALAEGLSRLVQEKRRIPKPNTDNPFTILRFGQRRKQTAVIYAIPCHTGKKPHYEKGITLAEFAHVLRALDENGSVTLSWFKEHLPDCVKEGSCNYTSLCGILELLGYCTYSPSERCYVKTDKERDV